ncbi:MAG: cation diffusion facilitator family transporter [Bacteroidia bacterium]
MHDHSHHHHHHSSTKNIALAFFLNVAFTVIEIIGGFFVNSVSILSDALHDLGDSFSLGISWYLQKKSENHANEKFTFGYKRFSLLGALINSVVLIIGSGFVIYHSVLRILNPEPTNATGMFLLAILGLAVNSYAAFKLSKGKSMNEKVLSWHLIEDVLGWAAVLVTSVLIYFWQLYILDPILSLCITAFVLWNVFKRLKETVYVFLQGAPADIDLIGLKQHISELPLVKSIHHTHIWTLDEESQVFTIHVVLRQLSGLHDIITVKNKIKDLLKKAGIAHATIDIELEDESCYMPEKDH